MATVARELATSLDATILAARLGYLLDPWQKRVLRSGAKNVIVAAGRQTGKSLVLGMAGVHECLFRPRATVLAVSPSQRQSAELLLKATDFYKRIGRPIDTVLENVTTLSFENGSRFISVPASDATIRGFSPSLVLADEASRIPDALMAGTIRPMLAVSRGRLWVASTPWGRAGWFAEAWFGEEDWDRFHVTALDCPRIDAEFLQRERRELGATLYAQEYEADFANFEGQVFDGEAIERMIHPELQPWGLLGVEWN